MKTPTIQDVAQRAGVGVGTVSRVLNNHAAVKPATRETVLQAIAALDDGSQVPSRPTSIISVKITES